MMSRTIQSEILEHLEHLTPSMQKQVLEYAKALARASSIAEPSGSVVPISRLLTLGMRRFSEPTIRTQDERRLKN